MIYRKGCDDMEDVILAKKSFLWFVIVLFPKEVKETEGDVGLKFLFNNVAKT